MLLRDVNRCRGASGRRAASSLIVAAASFWPMVAAAGDPEALFARSRLVSHLPASTVTMVLVDIDKVRASDASGARTWTDVVLGEISQRFRFEQHQLDLAADVAAFVYFEVWDGQQYGRGFLVERKAGKEARGLERGDAVRDFGDGTYAIAEARVLGQLQARSAPDHLAGLLTRLDPSAPILGVCRHRLVLTIPRCSLDPIELPLPAVAFALQVGFGDGVQLSGQLITQGPAQVEDGRAFLAAILDFLRPQGSFAPEGRVLAEGATLAASGDALTLRVRIPREALVVEPEAGNGTSEQRPSGLRMTTARGGQVMAALPDGRVIVAGGFDGQRGLATVEEIDPGRASSRKLPWDLTMRRVASAASLVAGEKLYLFYGMEGVGEGMEPASAEVLDLRGGASARIPVPSGPGRVGATATLLLDGAILVAGGAIVSERKDVPDAYVFDTESRSFTPVAAAMAVPRGDHAAVLLPDGSVLLAGGITERHAGPLTATMEIYDPKTRAFRILESQLPTPRTGLAGTSLHDGRAVLLGGYDNAANLTEIVAFDPRDGSVKVVGQMRDPRYYFAAVTLPDGRVLAAGGGMGRLAMRDSVEIWVPSPAAAR